MKGIQLSNSSSGEAVPGPACPYDGALPLIDSSANTFSALRIRNASDDVLYAEYRPSSSSPLTPASTNFTEAYDLTAVAADESGAARWVAGREARAAVGGAVGRGNLRGRGVPVSDGCVCACVRACVASPRV